VTELVSNTLKHAFPEGREGVVQVLLRRCPDDTLFLSVSDNANAPDMHSATSGWRDGPSLRIVEALTAQLNGEMTMSESGGFEPDGSDRNGTKVEVRMPLPEVASR
jgi:two-component sensor histidine kinase